ncbi:hypothetical protein CTAYLR_005900 [Chrysophaeum taylorii]|uniref:Uncharacterized protein n=1 Tax=Chrysophaeum taylorii TaxID=2483200 RepID=A0AAD7XNU1_9STRA|nr:hypothetical protein CTAYLR_005873 [Chrysophaeum taylorii]KAJ8614328.1 hypothetical protein CTAYLR_005900 [Chrysophaeum taylorii]
MDFLAVGSFCLVGVRRFVSHAFGTFANPRLRTILTSKTLRLHVTTLEEKARETILKEVIQFESIVVDSPHNENPLDLVVSVTEGAESYQVANASYNGRWHDFMKVNVRDNARAFLDFSFFDSVTGDAVELERFAFTVYDIDQQTDPSVQRESFCVDDDEFHYHVISDTSTLLVAEQSETCAGGVGSSVAFCSTRAGFLCDNPTSSRLGVVTCDQCQQCLDDEERLSQYFPINQADRSVLIAFIGPQTKFSIMLEVECEDCNDQPSGRNFVFGGWSGLCDPPNSTLAPASQPTSFNLELTQTTVFGPDGTEVDFDTAGTQIIVGDELALSYTFESTAALEVKTTAYLCRQFALADRVPTCSTDHHSGTVGNTHDFTFAWADDLDKSHGPPDSYAFA